MVDLSAPDSSFPPAGPPPVEVGHETRDVRFRPIVLAALALIGVGAGVLVLMLLLLNVFAARESIRSAPASPLAGAYGRQAPPAPRLQTDPIGDLAALRAEEDAALNRYEWIDPDAGVARVPIERAMELVLERGLRSAPGSAQSESAPPADRSPPPAAERRGVERIQPAPGSATDRRTTE